MFKKKRKTPKFYEQMTTRELINLWIISKLPKVKEKVIREQQHLREAPPPPPPDVKHIAIILDGVVEDVILAQPRLSALLLSGPTFVEIDTSNQSKPQVGITRYENGKFVNDMDDLFKGDKNEKQ